MAERKARILRLAGVLAASVVVAAVLGGGLFAWRWRAEDFRHAAGLKQLAIALIMYADDHEEALPPLSGNPGTLIFDMAAVFPEYIADPTVLLSPPAREAAAESQMTPAHCFDNSSYFYPGYLIWNEELVEAFAEAYDREVKAGRRIGGKLPVSHPAKQLHPVTNRIRWGYVTEERRDDPEIAHWQVPHADVPVLIEDPRPYPGPFGLWLGMPIPLSAPEEGGLVLYLDGHVEFIPYPGKWPMTEKTIGILRRLREMRAPP